jgi:hypothetical protein
VANTQNIFLYFNSLGALIQAKTYGYNDFNMITGRAIVFDSYGDFFYEIS